MSRSAIFLVLLLFAGGCVAASIDRVTKLDAILETETDAIVGQIEDRRCRLPVDVIERLAEDRGADWLRGWILQCPSAKRLLDSVQ